MIALLQNIVDLLVCWIETAAVTVVNALVVALGALAGALFAVLPSMPAFPTMPAGLSVVTWVFPLSTLVAAIVTAGTLFVALLAVQVALRWVKALD
jgi:hypothetical protein